ncbi:pentatricopeptide repeat-containing protein At3g51320-like [Aristolochia californica]|uniref:pentatricopeptide repeat-containing protein At3g51320-like n=1 Tax=Aristolochia californica TaxID=171875 RepID=UPI0035DA73FE
MARTSLREILRCFSPVSPVSFSSSSSSSASCLPIPSRISLYQPSIFPLQTCTTMTELLQIQAHVITSGLFQDPFAASRILKASADLGDLDYTVLIFRQIVSPDTFCVNTVIKSYSMGPNSHLAVRFYFVMRQKGFLPNSFTFPPMAVSCAKRCSVPDGEKCHGQVVKNGVDEVIHVRNALLHMYATCGLVCCARLLFDEMPTKDFVSWNSIIDSYVKTGNLINARKLFNEMPEKNVVSWNVMIAGYLKGRNPGHGLKLFREMGKLGVQGTATTMVSIVTACGRSNRLKEGRSVHAFFIRKFLGASLIFETALVDMYSKCRRVDEARRVFDQISQRNLICWNAMILGHCIHGHPEDGLALFAEMVGQGSSNKTGAKTTSKEKVMPDEVTFIGLLCACVRSGILTEGQQYFNEMLAIYDVKPKFAHYWCMANLYGSLGLIQEAEETLRRVPAGSESLLLSGLLGSCRFRGDVEVGERLAKHLIKLEPNNTSHYALLWNVYAVAGRWADVVKVKETMMENGVSKPLGSSLVDLNEVVHRFKVGDMSRSELEETHMMMDELAEKLKLPKSSWYPNEFG